MSPEIHKTKMAGYGTQNGTAYKLALGLWGPVFELQVFSSVKWEYHCYPAVKAIEPC